MIVAREALIVPRRCLGWDRSVFNAVNYQLESGEYGRIVGVVGKVPAGTEIDLGSGVVTLDDGNANLEGCVDILGYTSPSFVRHSYKLNVSTSYVGTDYQTRTLISENDALFMLRGGHNHVPEVNASSSGLSVLNFGTFATVFMNNVVYDTGLGVYDVEFTVKSGRSCVVTLAEIGNAAFDFGVMDAYIDGANAVASRMNNLFTGGAQISSAGALMISGGMSRFWVRFRYSNAFGPGTAKTGLRVNFDYEVPYGV